MAAIDWYSFMGGVTSYLSNHYQNAGKTPIVKKISDVESISAETYIFINDEKRYWIGVGPEVAYQNYHLDYSGVNATLNESHFEFGTEIDIVLRHQDDATGNDLVYVPCIFGMMKAHTYAIDYINGVFQTGTPYPYSDKANEDGSKHRDGSYVEFLRHPDSKGKKDEETGVMSK